MSSRNNKHCAELLIANLQLQPAQVLYALIIKACSALAVLCCLLVPTLYAEEADNALLYRQAILPLPTTPQLDERKVALGEQLFHDELLSRDQNLSCHSCHDLKIGGDDDKQFSTIADGSLRDINTPTVFNATHSFLFTWQGKHSSMETFFDLDILSPSAMNNNWPGLMQALKEQQHYVEAFAQIYPDGITENNTVNALVSFQQSLVTPNARFDQYLRGDEKAISEQEKRGYELFQSYGCVACHQGKNVGGNMFQKFGLFDDYFKNSGRVPSGSDFGRFNVTGLEEDRFYFRVPSLRNVAVTAPYLHDGAIETLDDAIQVMAKYQLGVEINEQDRQDIAAFLQALTGQYKELYLDEH